MPRKKSSTKKRNNQKEIKRKTKRKSSKNEKLEKKEKEVLPILPSSKEVKKSDSEEDTKSPKKQIEKENKQLRNLFIGIAIFLLLMAVFWWAGHLFSKIEVKGVEFVKVKEGRLVFYKTSLPVIYKGKETSYNIYFRTNPSKLEKIPFQGTLSFRKFLVLNMTDEFSCQGQGVIAIANMVNVFNVLGTKIVKDENASCDPEARYLYVTILPGNETRIEEYAPSCYNIYTKDCEILESTERFMLEALSQVRKLG